MMTVSEKSNGNEGCNDLEARNPVQVSKRDLKLLSLDFIGEADGVYYFRDPADQTRTYSGDREDYVEWRIVKNRHPMMDCTTANAALSMQKTMAVIVA